MMIALIGNEEAPKLLTAAELARRGIEAGSEQADCAFCHELRNS